MKVRSCLKPTGSVFAEQVRVIGSTEITQYLMMPQRRLQERLHQDLTFQRATLSTALAGVTESPASPSKTPVVTGLEILSLYSGNQEGAEDFDADDSSMESYCANSLVLGHQNREGLRRRSMYKIGEESTEKEDCNSAASLQSSSSSISFDDYDFCHDSFSRKVTTLRKHTLDDSRCPGIPDLDTFSCSSAIGRAA